MKRLLLALLLGLLVLGSSCNRIFAASTQFLPTEPKSGIGLKVSQCFDDTPRSGYAPVLITISNDTTAAHSWDFHFQSPGRNYGNNGNAVTFDRTLSVPPQTERNFDVLVPLALIASNQYNNSSISIVTTGRGAISTPVFLTGRNDSQNARISLGYSTAIEKRAGSDLRAKFDATHATFHTAIDFTRVPSDWRAFSGLDLLWITDEEWNALLPETRIAVEQWVATGGILYRTSREGISGEVLEKRGFGEIRRFAELGGAPAANAISAVTNQEPSGISKQLSEEYRNAWPDPKIIPPYVPNSVLLISIIVVFGILVGPFNFFVLGKREKRHRIFWTTPALSIGGALLVGGTILVQDGFNGWGKRVALIHLLPEQNSEVILQEQASRTALMTKSDFSTDATALVEPISLDMRPHQFSTDGENYGGDWFASRRIQGQWLATVRPSRARVQITNSAEFAAGQPPKILSSIAVNLDDFFWISSDSRVWHTANLGPGKTVALTPVNAMELYSKINRTFQSLAGTRLRMLQKRVAQKPNFFYATARAPQNVLLPSLSVIQWRDDHVLYMGATLP